MPTVPPGNKQIGEEATIVVASLTAVKSINSHNLTGFSTVKQTDAPTPTGVKNKLIGELATVTVAKAANKGVSCQSLAGYAAVFYSPPTKLKIQEVAGYAAVKDVATTFIASAPQNKFIGELSTVAVYSLDPNQLLTCSNLTGYAVVKEFHPRKELTIFNIEYAAEN